MSMSTCNTCRFWSDKIYDTVNGVELRKCTNVPMFWNATEWNDDGDGRTFTDKHADKLAFVQDGSDYSAVLITRGNFGCVSHTA